MGDLPVRVTARLADAEALVLRGACEMAAIGESEWIRHVLFGSTLTPSAPPCDAMATDALVRIGLATLVLKDRLVISDADDHTLLALADLAAAVRSAQDVVEQPYAVTKAAGIGYAAANAHRTRPVRIWCSTGERALVEQAAVKCGLSVGQWLGSAIVAGGLPEPAKPHTDPAGDGRLDDVLRVLTAWVGNADRAAVRQAIAEQMVHLIAGIRAVARLPTSRICEEIKS